MSICHMTRIKCPLKDLIISRSGYVETTRHTLSSWVYDGKLMVSKAYDWLRQKRDPKPWMRVIWKSYIPPNHSFILWLCLKKRLYASERWSTPEFCRNYIFCDNYVETSNHMFFRCSVVGAIWRKIREWLGIQRSMSTLLSSIKWIKKDHKGTLIHSKTIHLAFVATIYLVWNAWNAKLFTGAHLDVSAIVKSIQSSVYSVLFSMYFVDLISF